MYLIEQPADYQLPWNALETLIKGVSAVDLNEMPLLSREDAYEFVLNYGYDLNIKRDAKEIQSILRDAIRFIDKYFLSNEAAWQNLPEHISHSRRYNLPHKSLKIPQRLHDIDDVLELLISASSRTDSPEKFWACAILKVMHIMCHIDNVPLYQYFDKAREQILGRFYAILSQDDNGEWILGKPESGLTLRLFGFETKDQKPRDSILIKLLCKKENIAEGVWDLIGVRLITHQPAEAIRVIHILQETKVLLFPNIIPSRSRNTLLNFEKFRTEYNTFFENASQGRASFSQIESLFKTFTATPHPDDHHEHLRYNPATSDSYRSIHITGRQLIRLPNLDVANFEMATETRFFFPFEVQILDKASYLESQEGSSAHSIYKRKQLIAARRRVLEPLLLYLESSNAPNFKST